MVRESEFALMGLPLTSHIQSHQISMGIDKDRGEKRCSIEIYLGAGVEENIEGIR